MSIDAVAVLRIANLPPPPTAFGPHPVEHRGDATLINLMVRFDSADADEHALSLRRLVGSALDAHDDPRGILFFPDVCEPKGASYDAIVHELSSAGALSSAGIWAPNVGLEHVPVRYRGRPRQPHDVVVGELIGAMGRDAALEIDMVAQVNRLMLVSAPDRLDAVETYRAQLDAIARSLGAEFAARYDASLATQIDALPTAQERPPVSLADFDVTDAVNALLGSGDGGAPPNSHQGLVAEMIKVMGQDAAHQHNLTALDGKIGMSMSPDNLGAASKYGAAIEGITRAMGAEFAKRFEASLQAKADALTAG